MEEELALLPQRSQGLLTEFTTLGLKDPRAKEFATHGFARRIRIIERCIDNVFKLLPPSQRTPPTDDARLDAEINLQAFIFNVYGGLDNLAAIWAHERNVKNKNGKKLSPMLVGIGKKCEVLRASLPLNLQTHLGEMDGWLDYLENYRHALGHQIPLYIPPYIVPPQNEARHHAIDEEVWAAIRAHRFADAEKLEVERSSLAYFRAIALHSFEHGKPAIQFHPQMLVDFKTLESFARLFLSALQASKAERS